MDFLIHWPPGPVVATVQCQGLKGDVCAGVPPGSDRLSRSKAVDFRARTGLFGQIAQIAHHTLQDNVSNNLYLCSPFRTRTYSMDMVMTWQVQTLKYDNLKYGFPF